MKVRDHIASVPRILWAGATATLLFLPGCGGEGSIQQPAPLYGEVPIVYPLQLWDQDRSGETLLRVRVTATGTVDSVEVLQSAGYPAFDSAAVAGARKMRFKPAVRNGKRIEVWARVPVHFSKRPRPDTLGGLSTSQ